MGAVIGKHGLVLALLLVSPALAADTVFLKAGGRSPAAS
jgi:hypothetical protein